MEKKHFNVPYHIELLLLSTPRNKPHVRGLCKTCMFKIYELLLIFCDSNCRLLLGIIARMFIFDYCCFLWRILCTIYMYRHMYVSRHHIRYCHQ